MARRGSTELSTSDYTWGATADRLGDINGNWAAKRVLLLLLLLLPPSSSSEVMILGNDHLNDYGRVESVGTAIPPWVGTAGGDYENVYGTVDPTVRVWIEEGKLV
jgi:hypothetical protein